MPQVSWQQSYSTRSRVQGAVRLRYRSRLQSYQRGLRHVHGITQYKMASNIELQLISAHFEFAWPWACVRAWVVRACVARITLCIISRRALIHSITHARHALVLTHAHGHANSKRAEINCNNGSWSWNRWFDIAVSLKTKLKRHILGEFHGYSCAFCPGHCSR